MALKTEDMNKKKEPKKQEEKVEKVVENVVEVKTTNEKKFTLVKDEQGRLSLRRVR